MSDSLPVPQTPPASPTAPSNASGNSAVPALPDGAAPGGDERPPFEGLLDAALAAPEGTMLEMLPLKAAANPLAPLPQPGKDLPDDGGLPMAWNGFFLVGEPATPTPAPAAGNAPPPSLLLAALEGEGANDTTQAHVQLLAARTRLQGDDGSVPMPDPAFARRLEILAANPADVQGAMATNHGHRADMAALAPLPAHALVGGDRGLPQAPAITVPPQHPQWSQAVGERLHWMVGQQLQSAEIRLDPPELGSLDVKVMVNKDHATVHFVTHNPHVRDALEAATPRLREMFADAGLNLGDVNVSQESFQQQAAREEAGGQTTAGAGGPGDEEGAIDAVGEVSALPVRRGQGLLDTYV